MGNVWNNVYCAHHNALVLVAFLAIPKSMYSHIWLTETDLTPNSAMNEYSSDPSFHNFHRQLFHSLLSTILQLLKPAMTTPEVVKYADGHFQHTIYGLGSYIADYKEQVLLTCIVHGWCPRFGLIYLRLSHLMLISDVSDAKII